MLVTCGCEVGLESYSPKGFKALSDGIPRFKACIVFLVLCATRVQFRRGLSSTTREQVTTYECRKQTYARVRFGRSTCTLTHWMSNVKTANERRPRQNALWASLLASKELFQHTRVDLLLSCANRRTAAQHKPSRPGQEISVLEIVCEAEAAAAAARARRLLRCKTFRFALCEDIESLEQCDLACCTADVRA